ncbi:hypothetical protein D6D17_09181 [Aureobasidium pullulans]|nr:hypothetical protein D6D17_09181 [Aureobasidium pullulans]
MNTGPSSSTSPAHIILRQPVPAQPALPLSSFGGGRPEHTVTFKHPGYPDQFSQNILLTLHAFDDVRGGLHCGTAHMACAIVACNAWDGYFSRTRDGSNRLNLQHDDLILDKVLYFHVPSSDAKYPVYPDFANWAFPHDDLPPSWPRAPASDDDASDTDELRAPPSSSTLTAAVLRRDKTCVISGQRDCVERAHLCPRSEVDWFDKNGMAQYNMNGQLVRDAVIDDITNAIALRSDLHTTFDAAKFVVVPKQDAWVAHFTHLTNDLGKLYHNTVVAIDKEISANCLLARFAWAIFPLVSKFLMAGAARQVRTRVVQDGELTEVTEMITAEQAKAKFAGGRSRSTSPRKRKVTDTTNDDIVAQTPPLHRPKRRCKPPGDASSTTATISDAITPRAGEEEGQMQQLKRSWLLRQRPDNPALYCCDPAAAEAADEAGIVGKEAWGGGHLCDECLGAEYRDPIEQDGPQD